MTIEAGRASFPDDLPRLKDLWRRHANSTQENFFHLFPERLRACEVTFEYYADIEDCLDRIPWDQWSAFADKVSNVANHIDPKGKRHWEKLHDLLNEARGARLLHRVYRCGQIELIGAVPDAKTPDWKGINSEGVIHYAEVKTINHSEENQAKWAGGPSPATTPTLSCCFRKKLRETCEKAREQLMAAPSSETAVKAALLAIHVDDHVSPVSLTIEGQLKSAVEALSCGVIEVHYEWLKG
jgi:hypothetical protein